MRTLYKIIITLTFIAHASFVSAEMDLRKLMEEGIEKGNITFEKTGVPESKDGTESADSVITGCSQVVILDDEIDKDINSLLYKSLIT